MGSMATQPSFDVAHTAVLSMDLQTAVTSIYTKGQEDLLTRAASVIKGARECGVRVIHIQIGFRPGVPEINPNNPLFRVVKDFVERYQLVIDPAVEPRAGEVVITKHRTSAFTGTALDMILRAQGITTLILLGIATSGVVLSTLLQASDADYRTIVIKDCCTDLDQEVHKNLVEKIFPQVPQTSVLSTMEFLDTLSQSAVGSTQLR
jgi:nicotinamidase-related amidase